MLEKSISEAIQSALQDRGRSNNPPETLRGIRDENFDFGVWDLEAPIQHNPLPLPKRLRLPRSYSFRSRT
jgi:hypothetical protein